MDSCKSELFCLFVEVLLLHQSRSDLYDVIKTQATALMDKRSYLVTERNMALQQGIFISL